MTNVIKLRRGLDIRLKGVASQQMLAVGKAGEYALMPSDFVGVIPRVVVKEGDRVLAGDSLFVRKDCPEVGFASPVSGRVKAVVRGERRKVLCVKVDASGGHPGVAVDFFLHFEVEAVGFVVLENVVHFLVAVCGEADHVFVVIDEDCAVIVEDVGIVGLFHCVFVYFFDVFRIGDVEHGYFHAVCRSGFFVGVHSDSEEEVVTVKVQVF